MTNWIDEKTLLMNRPKDRKSERPEELFIIYAMSFGLPDLPTSRLYSVRNDFTGLAIADLHIS